MIEKAARGFPLSLALGTAGAVAGIGLGAYESLWERVGVTPELRVYLTVTTAVLSLLLGFLYAVYERVDAVEGRVERGGERLSDFLLSRMPSLDQFECRSGAEAMHEIGRRFGRAKSVRNTKVFPNADYHSAPDDAEGPWQQGLLEGVQNGLVFREVVSQGCEANALERIAALKSGVRGSYKAYVLRDQIPSFLNFVILDFGIEGKEVWFGWVISPGHEYERVCVRTREQHIVGIFESWFERLVAGSREVVPKRPTAKAVSRGVSR